MSTITMAAFAIPHHGTETFPCPHGHAIGPHRNILPPAYVSHRRETFVIYARIPLAKGDVEQFC